MVIARLRSAERAVRTGIFCILIAAALPLFSGPTQAAAQPQKVVELFTSQGCSSCPPADRLAERMVKDMPEVLTLVMPVDYWDYLGWKDTLANPMHSERQRAYAARRGDRSVYTPQMVVNGAEHVIGSHEDDVLAAIDRADAFRTEVDFTISDMAVEAHVSGSLPDGAKMATVYFLRVDEEVTVDIEKGENANRTIRYVNVVRTMQPIGMWSGGEGTFRMAKSKLDLADDTRCIILIQIEGSDGPGQIIGAAVSDWRQGM